MTLTRHDIQAELTDTLEIDEHTNLIAHINVDAFGPVEGGAESVVDALLSTAGTIVMPAFTYQTQVIPQDGPPDNAIEYGTGDDLNARAEFFRPDLPVHPDCGAAAESLRQRPDTLRSLHPILSFIASGAKARSALAAQTAQNPLGPVAWLEAHDGIVLLMGVDQRHNYALHLAEQRAGRKTFIRWALTLDDIEEMHHIPGCMEGFNDIWRYQFEYTRVTQIGLARCERIELRPMLKQAERRLHQNANFMLCDKPSCLNCRTRQVR
jgi:aminoglycoside 3-N-acetyltransferase